jgi:hypothetical protein
VFKYTLLRMVRCWLDINLFTGRQICLIDLL